MRDEIATIADANRFLNRALRELTTSPAPGYTPLASANELEGRVNSPQACRAIFRAEANPYNADPPAKAAFHLDPDRIRLEYQALGMRLLVVDEPNMTFVRVLTTDVERLLRMKPEEQLGVIDRIGSLLFKLELRGTWVVRPPSSNDEAVAFGTNPSRHMIALQRSEDRVDAGVFKGELYYMIYKPRPGKFMGIPTTGWLNDVFRAEHRARRK